MSESILSNLLLPIQVTAIILSHKKKIPITDNRHAKRKDVFSVFAATMSIVLLGSSFIYYPLICISIFLFILWFYLRFKLFSIYRKSGKFFFYIKALILMFILDIIRAICVLYSFIKVKIFRNTFLDNLL